LTSAFFGSVRIDQGLDIQWLERSHHRQSTDELGNHPEFHQIFRLRLRQDVRALGSGFHRRRFGLEPDLPFAQTPADDVV